MLCETQDCFLLVFFSKVHLTGLDKLSEDETNRGLFVHLLHLRGHGHGFLRPRSGKLRLLRPRLPGAAGGLDGRVQRGGDGAQRPARGSERRRCGVFVGNTKPPWRLFKKDFTSSCEDFVDPSQVNSKNRCIDMKQYETCER